MPVLQRQIQTRLDPETAFRYVADFATSATWDPNTATSERVGDGPVGVGSTYRLEVRLGSRLAPMTYRIRTFEPPAAERASARVVLDGEGSGVRATDDIRFSPAPGGGSTIEYTADIRLGGLLRVATPFLGGAFRKLADDAAAGMQATLDAMADEPR